MSNPVVQQLLSHKTIRQFDPAKKIAPEITEQILRAVQQAPSSCHAQQIGVITVQDPARRQHIMELAKGRSGVQQHIADAPLFLLFVADYHKVGLVMKEAGKPFELIQSVESMLTAGVDTGICLEAAVTAAESFGLGTVCIGALRWHDLAPLIEYMELPQNTFPMCGLCIGYASAEGEKTKIKPRLPFTTFVHPEKYNAAAFKDFSEVLKRFNQEMSAFAGAPVNWVEGIGTVYSNPLLGRHLAKNFSDQGFKI